MKRFVFRLDRVLDLREREEKERARQLGHALRAEQARKEALEQAERKLGRCGEQISEAAESGVTNAGTLRNLDLTIKAVAGEVEAAEESHQKARDHVETEKELFGEARKGRRVVERLKERRRAQWSVDESRQEQREFDEIAQNRRTAEES